ncbi:predicted protein [Postia placenta Mad-698-R]|nr:predicted protein [Postia placenta Mad-698-R]
MGLSTLVLGLVAAYYVWLYLDKPKKALPPGPKPLPIVGNITNLTAQELWLRASQWAKSYGDVVYLHVFGQGLVFLNDYDAAVDLLEKRGAIYSDKPGLIMAGDLEVLRWGVPVPLSLPHRLMEDDVYNGMHIPKGSLVFGNVWNMVRNPALFPDPDAFVPERYLAPADEATARRRDPRNYVFGFGRRRCPGMHLIEQSLWIVMASMVATLDISKARDAAGRAVEPEVVFDNAVFRTPRPFRCDIRPRSEQALRVVRQAADAAA